jgi:hypothetical protein
MHGLAHRLIAAKREREIGYAAGDMVSGISALMARVASMKSTP